MGSDNFSFKQFSIFQGNTPMKVGTDSVLLGAWVTSEHPKRILDIGTGTGLLSLMMAQRFQNAIIDAIEIHSGALTDAKYNIENSPFLKRINLIEADYNQYFVDRDYTYDLIISNPPYFKNSLQSPAEGRNTARHQNELSLSALLGKSVSMLSNEGIIALILPEELIPELKQVAILFGLNVLRETTVKSKPTGKIIRRMMTLGKKHQGGTFIDEIILHDGGRAYSEAVKRLTSDFYLK